MSLPSGIVTFVFSDIEQSTSLWETDPEGMKLSLKRHDDITRTEVEAAGGTLFKHTGDGFGAVFQSVTAGLDACTRVAAALAHEPWEGPALSCRMGLHAGEAEPRDGDYFGSTVTRTARITEAGNGGQILVSEAARQLCGGYLPPDSSLIDMGEHRLKDLGEPIRLHRLVGLGADDTRDLRTLERSPHNLPVQLSSFIGREVQIKEVSELIRAARLVTLTGIGGVGKTRLSLQVAAELLSEFGDGAWLVELAALSEPGLLADTACNALAVPQDSSIPAEERLMEFLAARRALLVMDNCEHLIDDVASFVESLLRACPDVHVLATSREGLGVTGESLWRVPSLRVDEDAAAVELFSDRARLVQPGFAVTEENREAVSDICNRLDGIPLAIELATARLKMLSVEQVARHLDDRFRLLTGGGRTSVERQRTLKAMMDWSHDLLTTREKALLRRLAVFVDGFTYEAAEDVCSDDTVERLEILDLLGRLVEASLVIFEPDPRPRYRLLDTVRQYALDRLFEANESDAVRLRHAEHFRSVSEGLREAFENGDFGQAHVGDDDLGNLRAAMTWATESNQGELALELACNMRQYFWNRIMHGESLRWMTGALDLVEDDASTLVPLGVCHALAVALNVGAIETFSSLELRAQKLFDQASDARTRGLLASSLAGREFTRDIRLADRLEAEATRLLREADAPYWHGAVQNRFITAWIMSDSSLEDEVLPLVDDAEKRGTAIHAAVVRIAFATLAEDYEYVIDFVERREMLDEFEEAILNMFKSHCERATGRLESALRTIERSAAVPGRFADGWIGWQRGMARLQLGDIEGAIAGFHAPRAFDADMPFLSERANVAWFCALVSELRGEHERAALLLGYAERISEETSARPHPFDRRLIEVSNGRIRESLGESGYDAVRARGRTTAWEDLPLIEGIE